MKVDEKEEREGLGRFHVELLEKPGFPEKMAECWTKLDSQISWDIRDVDAFDSVLSSAAQAVFEEVLGTYDVLKRRKSSDRVQPRIQSQISAIAAIRLFKRKQRRTKSNMAITSRSKEGSAMSECTQKFSKLFNEPSQVQPPGLWSRQDELSAKLRGMVSREKIVEFLKRYPKDKSCGADSIHTLLMLALQGTSFISRLSALFDLCIRVGETPTRWNESIMYLLPKTKEPPVTCDAVRPLSILSMFRRVFEALILPEFTNTNHEFARLHPCQAGFRKGYSTLTHAAICHHALSTDSVRLAIFLDFRAAYDVTAASRVMEALKRRGMPPILQRLVYSLMFNEGCFRVVVNGDLSRSIRRGRGLPQGSVLSPIVFDMFIDSLVQRLNQRRAGLIPSCLFFADDGLLLCKTISEARALLRVAERWAIANQMAFNVSKCGVIVRDPSEELSLTLCGSEIPIVEEYKYLGFMITKEGIDFVQDSRTKARAATAFLTFARIQCSEWTPYARHIVYNTFIRPKLEYGAPLLYAHCVVSEDWTALKPIQQAQDDAINWIFDSSTKNHNVLRGLLGALTVEKRFRHLRAGFQLHLHDSDGLNPIRPLTRASSRGQLLWTLRSDDLFDKFISWEKRSPEHLKESFAQFILEKRKALLLESGSVLVGYVPLSARTDGLVDRVFTAPTRLQSRFTLWRRGTLFVNRKCLCGQRWNRGHISCIDDGELPKELTRPFEEEKKTMSKNFCKLDFLLNVRHWDEAESVIEAWTNKLATC